VKATLRKSRDRSILCEGFIPLRRGFVVALVLLAASLGPLSLGASAQDIRIEVEGILATPQSHSGEMVDKLAELGKPAVPTLLEKLDTFSTPMVLVQALGRIGDERATLPLLALLNKLDPFAPDAGEHHFQRLMVIAALREIGDERAEPLLHLILGDEKASIGTRLAAATALARFGSADAGEEAQSFILTLEKETRGGAYRHLHTGGAFSAIELDQALAELGTEESQAILVQRLMTSGLANEELAIIHLLARKSSPSVAEAMLEYAERGDREPYIRLKAVRALVDLGEFADWDRIRMALQDIREHLPLELRPEIDSLLEIVKAR